jgi:hypothetical protein
MHFDILDRYAEEDARRLESKTTAEGWRLKVASKLIM